MTDTEPRVSTVLSDLHKILFFRLPYRFSSDGSGAAGDSKMGEGEKMDRLQAEVLGYQG